MSVKQSVAAEALRRDDAQRDEESQYDELFDHGTIVASPTRLRTVSTQLSP
ncbi:MAG: hypothetical protein ABSA14_05205 [Acidimicrobiales bacterium]|jgi:hypothetical protein